MEKKHKTSFFLKILFGVNIFFAILLLLSSFSSTISPQKLWISGFFGLLYPYFLMINLAFVAFWLIFKRKFLLLSLPVILFGWNNFGLYLRFNKAKAVDSTYFKVMSYNVRLFGLYNYSKNVSYRDKIIKLIADEKPDILSLQEYYYDKTGKFRTEDLILKNSRLRYHYDKFVFVSRDNYFFGISTFSRYPIAGSGSVIFENSRTNSCIFNDIIIHGDTIRVYNIHFASIHFAKEDYNFIAEISNNTATNKSAFKVGIMKILSKMKHAFILRASQCEKVRDHILTSPYPVIVTGDFNDTPGSYAYYTIRSAGLSDAFTESGKGPGFSYAGIFPSFRIDYILYGKSFKSLNFVTIRKKYSDHYPISCYLKR